MNDLAYSPLRTQNCANHLQPYHSILEQSFKSKMMKISGVYSMEPARQSMSATSVRMHQMPRQNFYRDAALERHMEAIELGCCEEDKKLYEKISRLVDDHFKNKSQRSAINEVIEDFDGNSNSHSVSAGQLNSIEGIDDAQYGYEALYVLELRDRVPNFDELSQKQKAEAIKDAIEAVNKEHRIGSYSDNNNDTDESNSDRPNRNREAVLSSIAEDVEDNGDEDYTPAADYNSLAGVSGAKTGYEDEYAEKLAEKYPDFSDLTDREKIAAINDVIDLVHSDEDEENATSEVLRFVNDIIEGDEEVSQLSADDLNGLDGVERAREANLLRYIDRLRDQGDFDEKTEDEQIDAIQNAVDWVNQLYSRGTTGYELVKKFSDQIDRTPGADPLTAADLNRFNSINGAIEENIDRYLEEIREHYVTGGAFFDATWAERSETLKEIVETVNEEEDDDPSESEA